MVFIGALGYEYSFMIEEKTHFCWKRFCGTSFWVSLEAVALITAFLGALSGIILWRLSQSPVDFEFARPMVEKALNERLEGKIFNVDKLILHWPDMDGPLLLGLQDGRLTMADGSDVLHVDEVGMGLSLPHLLIGRIVPTALVVRGPHISVVVEADSTLDVGFGTSRAEASVFQDEQQSLLERIVGYVGSPYHDSDSSPLAALKRFEISGAVVNVEDRSTDSVVNIPRFDMRLQTQDGGLGGKLEAYLDAGAAEPHVAVMVTLPWQAQEAEAKIALRDFPVAYVTDRIDGVDLSNGSDIKLSGDFKGLFNQDLKPLAVHVDMQSAGGDLVIDGYRAGAVAVIDFRLAGLYDGRGDVETLALDDLSLKVAGVPFVFKGQVGAVDGGYDVTLAVRSDGLMAAQFVDILPDSLQEEGAYEWLTQKLSGGRYTGLRGDADMGVRFVDGAWDARINTLETSFDYSDMVIDYRAPLVPITEAKGSGSFDYVSELLHVDLASGKVGALDARGGQVELAHIIEGGRGIVDANLTLAGPLRDMFVYLEQEPIAFDHGYDLKRVAGDAVINVNVGLQTYGDVQMEDVALSVRGDVNNGVLPKVLQDTDLTAVKAALVIDGNDVSIKGTGQFLAEPLRFDYAGFLSSGGQKYQEKIKVSGRASEAIRKRFGLDLSSFMSGSADVDVTYINVDDVRQSVDVTANLKDALVFVEPVSYVKGAGAAGKAKLRLNLRKGVAKDVSGLSVQAEGLDLQGGNLVFAQRGGETVLLEGSAPVFKVAATEGVLEFEVSPAGQYKLTLDLDTLDLRPVLSKEEKSEEGAEQIPLVLSIKAEHVLTKGDGFVRQGKIYLDADEDGRFNRLELDALTESGSDIYLRYKPDEADGRVFRFEADDAGETLAAFGLYDQIRGGKILVYADPIGGDENRNLVGVAEISNFEVVGAPTLAKLLSLMSLEGLAKGMTGTGIQFSRLESKFDWLYRPQGSLLVLQEGRTSGAAVGLTFDGVVDQGAGTIDLSGTVIPVSAVNNVIRSIPLFGEILTGGSGVFAATYSVKGKTEEPKVSVNPLSVLAPGIIRRILFE